MRAAAQIDKVALPIKRQGFIRRNIFDDLGFVFLPQVAKEFNRVITCPDLACDHFVALYDLEHALRDDLEVFFGKRFLAREVVIKAVLDGRPDRYLGIWPEFLYGFS